MPAEPKNKSELLFEGYLRAQGHLDFEYEPVVKGTAKRPDYQISFNDSAIFLDVKEFRIDPKAPKLTSGYFDPYPVVREKFDAGRRKFGDLKQHCCCLVLYNLDRPLVLLDWQHIYGAMLGNVGFSLPLKIGGLPAADGDQVTSIFMRGGKMHRERDDEIIGLQNQTISAVLVLNRIAAGRRRLHAALRKEEHRLGRRFTSEEWFGAMHRARRTELDVRVAPLRVVVHENPYARIPFPSELCRGPFDERYGVLDGRIQQIFQGRGLADLPLEA